MAQGELAFLSLTGKIELAVRDKLAWSLQLWAVTHESDVTREWGLRVWRHADIAVLKKGEPEAILELKAMMVANIKGDRFFEGLRTAMNRWTEEEKIPKEKVLGILLAVNFKNDVPKELFEWKVAKYRYASTDELPERCDTLVRRYFEDSAVNFVIIPGGRCFGVDIEVLAWLIGSMSAASRW